MDGVNKEHLRAVTEDPNSRAHGPNRPTAGDQQATVAPTTLTRASSRITPQADDGGAGSLDLALLHEELVGHPALAQSLQEFAMLWAQRTHEYRQHLDALGSALRTTGVSYRDTDDTTAQRFSRLDAVDTAGQQDRP